MLRKGREWERETAVTLVVFIDGLISIWRRRYRRDWIWISWSDDDIGNDDVNHDGIYTATATLEQRRR